MSGTQPEPPLKKITAIDLAAAVGLVMVIQLIAIGLTYANKPVYVAIGPVQPVPVGNSTAGSAVSVLILVGGVFAVTLGMVWLLRRRLTLSFKTVVFASTSFSAFVLTWLNVDAIFSRFPWYSTSSEILVLEIAVSLLPVAGIAYTVFVRNSAAVSALVLSVISAEVGSFFASTLPLATAVILPLAFAMYDVYAVFRGPLKQLVGGSGATTALAGMSVKAGEFTVGLGDLVFYSMIPALAYFYLPAAYSAYALAAVDLGVAVTLSLLARKRLLPGLPIPMLLGVVVVAVGLLAA